jgi:hypothetical protein
VRLQTHPIPMDKPFRTSLCCSQLAECQLPPPSTVTEYLPEARLERLKKIDKGDQLAKGFGYRRGEVSEQLAMWLRGLQPVVQQPVLVSLS